MQRLVVAGLGLLLVLHPGSAWAEDCCGGKPSKAGSDAVAGKPVRWLVIRLGALKGDADGAKTLAILKGLPEVAAAELTDDRGEALLAVPTAYVDFPGLEKALVDQGIAGTLVNPVRLMLKLARSDGKVDVQTLSGSYALAAGVISTAPVGTGDVLAVYADPELADLREVTAVATQRGYQVDLTSHAVVEVAVKDPFCDDCRGLWIAALHKLPGVVYVSPNRETGSARVLVEKGKSGKDALEKALAAAAWDGKRSERPEACPTCHNRK